MPTLEPALSVENVSVRYGPIAALREVSITVMPRSISAVLGANGAGKSSLLRVISGLIPPAGGTIKLKGADITGKKPHVVTRAGISHVPEGRRVVGPLTVEDNLKLAALAARRSDRKGVTAELEEVYELFPKLRERGRQTSNLLSGGEQQMLAIGRGLMAKPEVLLLDEPSMGLAPIVIDEIYALLSKRSGSLAEVGILLAEQSAVTALSVADFAYIFAGGTVAFAGTPKEIYSDEALLEAYFGRRRSRELPEENVIG